MNQEIIFYAAAFLTALLGLVVGFIANSYRQLIKKYYSLKQEVDQKQDTALKQSAKIVDDAKSQSKKIIDEAFSANQLLQKNLADELEIAKQKQRDAYQAILNEVQKDSINMMSSISNDIKSQVSSETEKFINTIHQEILKSHQNVLESIKQDYHKVREDIDSYKQDLYQKLDESIFQVISVVSSKVLGESLSLEQHEKLVFKALNEAKRQHIV
jgi:F0F1-type ATP synthase membrane subunit b/b'